MRITDRFPFAAELIGPLNRESFRRDEAVATAGEVTLDASWIVMPQGDDPILATATRYLSGFLAHSMEIGPMRVEGCRLLLRVDPALSDVAEAHCIEVARDRITVTGRDPSGTLQGCFHLARLMKERGGPFVPLGEITRQPLFKHRVHRSCLSPFYLDELTGLTGPPFDIASWGIDVDYPAFIEEDTGPQTYYHDNYLLRLAEHGFNGIWIRACLRHFARSSVFPEFGEHSDAILGALRDLCRRANGQGMKVFCYIQEPLGFHRDHPFWQAHPDVRGVLCRVAPMYTMCTSIPQVRDYIREGAEYLFAHAPELSGLITISCSEFPSHCYCHQGRPVEPEARAKLIDEGWLCPRCAERSPQEVIAETVTLLRDGVKAANPAAEVIAWNWSWSAHEPDPQTGVLERLPEDVIVMGDYERGEPARALDFDYTNDEYSIKVVGPSARFRGVAEFQRSRGRPVYAKLQIGTTHENPNIPYLPVPHKLAWKYQGLPGAGVTGMMTCWNFGNMLSLGTEVCNEFAWSPQEPDADAGLRRVASRWFGRPAADQAVAGWRVLSDAQDDFPGSIPVMYYGPISRGPAFALEFDRIDKAFPNSWLLDVDTRGDQLGWATPFGPAKTAACYRAVAAGWLRGIAVLEAALPLTDGADRERLVREIGLVKFARTQLVSSANVVEFLVARDEYLGSEDSAAKLALLDRMLAVCLDERENAAAAIPLWQADSRLGWHGEAYGYTISRELIEQKLARLDEVIERRIPEEQARLGSLPA
ncbi:MAG: hypothetical protein HYU66_02965 [Armatimonadetes bacterium]|nr:hypothetical protein [Armatimonadota bacterium]